MISNTDIGAICKYLRESSLAKKCSADSRGALFIYRTLLFSNPSKVINAVASQSPEEVVIAPRPDGGEQDLRQAASGVTAVCVNTLSAGLSS